MLTVHHYQTGFRHVPQQNKCHDVRNIPPYLGYMTILPAQHLNPIQFAPNDLKQDALSQICLNRWTARNLGQATAAAQTPAIILLLARKMFANIAPRAVQVTVATKRRSHLFRQERKPGFSPAQFSLRWQRPGLPG
jgi:hypothetical protein